ncbi:aspartate carbamoyltransferase [Myxococcota bacterium]|nr:aspartate carbamoyltransferase [Myxococcota bacterium]MBU1379593.1 aspartate carbamoyltransferase [Myxococcota bacterium]MBU1498304.1 aspartate carbamoyltransferase [Myxococcota bacterium]
MNKTEGLIDINQLDNDGITQVLDLAQKFEDALNKKDIEKYKLAGGKDLIVSLLFYENSTRTRSSFEIAAMRLGMSLTGFGSLEGSSVKKGESLGHTLDMFDAYQCDALILRHPLDGSARYASERMGIPVFNAGDGKHQHPTQTALDLYTIRQHLGRIDDFAIGFGGDLRYGRTSHSLVMALSSRKNVSFYFYSHPSLGMPADILELLEERKCHYEISDNLPDVASVVDIFYMTRIQKERLPDGSEFEKAKKMAAFTPEIMALTRDSFGLMHPLPIDKTVPGILPDLDFHPKSIYKKQAGNGVPVRMALLALSLGLADELNPALILSRPKDSNDFIKELPVKDSLPKEGVSIRPIRKHGVVLDHLLPWTESILIELLEIKKRRDIYRSATVRSVSRPENIKGMLMIEDRELTMRELKLIASVSPGARVNIINESRVARKLELSLPDVVEGIDRLCCPNSGCISHPRHSEHVSPIFVKVGKSTLKCHYCDTIVKSSNLLDIISPELVIVE